MRAPAAASYGGGTVRKEQPSQQSVCPRLYSGVLALGELAPPGVGLGPGPASCPELSNCINIGEPRLPPLGGFPWGALSEGIGATVLSTELEEFRQDNDLR